MVKVRVTLQFYDAPKEQILDYLEDIADYDNIKLIETEWIYSGDDLEELEHD